MARRAVLGLLVLVVLMPATTSAGAGPRTGTPSELFVLTAADVRLSHASGKGNAFELVLDRPAGSVSGFSDRPQRLLSRRSLGGFVRGWGNLGFRSDPPNAALVVDHAPSSADVFVFELSRPALGAGGRTLTFDARALERRPTGILARVARGADTARAGGFGRGSLFIDGSGQAASLVFSFTALSTESQGGAVTFTNATITDADVSVPSQQAGAFAEAAVDSTSFQLGSNGNGPFSATITVDVEVDSGATSLNGTATVPQGGSGTVSVEEGPTRTLQFGNFSLPLS